MISADGAMDDADLNLDADAGGPDASPVAKTLPPAAQRALAEAAARRAETESRVAALPKEIGGRGGKEPVRYGDWEVKGIASDF